MPTRRDETQVGTALASWIHGEFLPALWRNRPITNHAGGLLVHSARLIGRSLHV